MVDKLKKRSLLLQKLEERILWDATLQPESPEPASNDARPIDTAPKSIDTELNLKTDELQDGEPKEGEVSQANIEETDSSSATTALADDQEATNALSAGLVDSQESEVKIELVIIDQSVENSDALVADILSQNEGKKDKELVIITIDSTQSGVDQITEQLSSLGEVDAVHVLGHGDDAQIYIGNDVISSDNVDSFESQFSEWSAFLSEDADILFYGCDVVENESGADLLNKISIFTEADVSGSDDTTGSQNRHADWDLEYQVGEVETKSLLISTADANWSGVLALDAPIGGINAPAGQMIDEDPTFELCFDSPPGSDPGFGPYGDFVVSDEVDIDAMTFLGAPVSFIEVGTWNGTSWTGLGPVPQSHPFDATAAAPLGVPAGNEVGDVWYAIELPFGSYTESQPKATIEVSASFNNNAEVGNPVDMSWTPGYLLGSTADGSAADPIQGTTTTAQTVPEVIQITKRSDLPEAETATGPNYPVKYTITVNVANAETVSDVVVTDYLPANSVFLGSAATLDQTTVDISGINGGSSSQAVVDYNAGANTIEIDLGSMTGTAVGAGEIEIEYYVYFEDIVTDGAGVPNTNSVQSLNESTVVGEHNGVTVTDSGDADSAGPNGSVDDGDVMVEAQNLTVQKTPQLVTGFNADGSPILAPFEGSSIVPGALIYWTVDVQVSDYHAFDNIAFTDQLSDGQQFQDGSSSFTMSDGTVVAAADLTPTLFVGNDSDFGGNTDDTTATPIDFDAAHVYTAGETPPATLDVADGGLTSPPGTSATGEVTTIFDISGQLRANGTDGVLGGDLNNTNDLDGDTGDSPLPGDITVPRFGANATTISLNFFSSINEAFADVPGDAALNSGDPVGNDGEIEGDVGDIADDGTFTPDPLVTGPLIDDTSFLIEVAGVSIEKSIYAVNQVEIQNPDFFDGSANPDEDDNESDEAVLAGIQPGDEVTYRIRVELASVNGENFIIKDFLPIPVYDVDLDFAPTQFSNTPGLAGSSPVVDISGLVAGNAQFGEDYNLDETALVVNVAPTGSGTVPGTPHPADNSYSHITFDAANNQLLFDFGTFNEDDAAGAGTDDLVVIDLLLTSIVRDVNVRDTSYITNQAQVSETDSSGNPIVTDDIVQIQYLAPDLAIQKGVVAISSDSAGSLTGGSDFGVNFENTDPGTAGATPATDSLDFQGNNISLTAFQADNGILDSNAVDVDGGDHVRYALTVFNEGGGDAHNIHVQDTLPSVSSGFIIPSDSAVTADVVNDLNLQIYDGAGNRLTAGTDFTVVLNGGQIEIDIIKELDGQTLDSDTGEEIADSDEIRADANPGNGDADEVKQTVDGDELFIIVYDLELDNELALDSSGAYPDFTYTNTAQITEYYQTNESDPLRNNDNNVALRTDAEGNLLDNDLIATAEVTTPDLSIEKNLISTELDTANNTNVSPGQATIGERLTYEVRIEIPEGQIENAVLSDKLDRGLELSSIDSIKFEDSNGDAAAITTDSTAAAYSAPDAAGEILAAPITAASAGALSYDYQDNSRSEISLDLGSLMNSNDDSTTTEYVVITYTVMVTNDSITDSGDRRNNEAKLDYQVEDVNNPGVLVDVESNTDRATEITIIEPKLEIVKTVAVNGVDSTGTDNDEVNPDTAQGDTGDPVTYTMVIQHTGDSDTDAYDTTFTDTIPSGINGVTLVSAIYSGDGSDLAGTDITAAGNAITTSTDFTVELGETVTVTVTGTIAPGANIGEFIDNTADITWTSYPETPDGTDFVPAGQEDVERGPSSDPSLAGGESNPYSDSDPARIELSSNTIEKYIVNTELTNEADATADGQLAAANDSDGINRGIEATIGETLTYEVVVTVGEGTTNNAVIVDTLDPGLTLVSIDSVSTRQFDTVADAIIAGPAPSLTIENDATDMGIPATDASNAFISYTHNAGASSDEISLTLGDIVNGNNSNDIDEQIVLRYTVMVSDIAGNVGNDAGSTGTLLNNSAEMEFTDLSGATNYSTGPDSADEIEVVEPDLEVDKSVAIDGVGDAGDAVTYTITIEHSADSESDAYDVSLSDVLPSAVDFSTVNFATGSNINITDSNSVLTSADFEINAGTLQFASTANTQLDELGNNTVDFQLGASPRELTIEITGVLMSSVQPEDVIENDANIQYSSLDQHDDGSTNPVGDGDDEEDRSSFVPGAGEDSQRIYNDTDDADFTVPSPTIEKELTGTDVTADGNAANEATIGELVTYTVTVTVPEGTINGVEVLDTLDAGLTFHDIVSVTGTANGSDVATDLAGGFGSVTGATTGQDITFDLGNLTVAGDNTGTDASASSQGDDQIVIVYRAVVTDIVANVDGAGNINNSASLSYEDASMTTQTTAPVEADPISVVEPELEVIKQINGLADETDATGLDAGDAVTYTITIQHTGDSSTTAFDTVLNDPLPSQLDFSGIDFAAGTNVSVTDSAGTLTSSDFAINAGALQFDVGGATPTSYDIELDRVITISITGEVNVSSAPGETVTNQADINWTSLPEGHENDGQPNERGEQGFDGEGAGVNPYDDSDDIAYTTLLPNFSKDVISSSIHGDTDSDSQIDLTIGEEVTYELVATLTEGTTPLIITDTLPATADADGDLTFVKAEVVFIGAGVSDSGNLSLGDTDVSAADISVAGDVIEFDFGTVVLDGNNTATAEDNLIKVRVTAVVTNIGANTSGDELTNSATMNISSTPATPGVNETFTDTAEVDILEPELEITKDFVDPVTGDPVTLIEDGGTVRIRLEVENTGTANAYDVSVNDLFNDQDIVFINPVVATTPAGFTYTFNDGGAGAGTAEATDEVVFSADSGVFIPPVASAPANTIVFEFDVEVTDAVLGSSVFEGLRIDNTATVTGDSIDGDPLLADGSPNTQQRDTSDSDSDSIVSIPGFEKSVLSTNVTDASNGANDVTIGERVVYQISFELPDTDSDGDGTAEAIALTVTDNLPQTLELLDARVISIGADITAPDLSPGDSLLGGAAAIASNDTNADGVDDEAVLSFGDVIVDDDDNNVDADQTIVIEIEAIVKDDPLNIQEDTTDPADDNINDKVNQAEMTFGEITNSDTATVEVIEPVLEIEKNFVDPATGQPIFSAQAGDVVQIELTIENTGTAVAYDTFVEDDLSSGVTAAQYVDGSGVVVNNGGFTDNSDLSAGNNLARFDQATLAPGASTTFRINVTLAATLSLSAGDAIDNTATVEGESLPSTNPDQATESRNTSDEDQDFIFGIPAIEKEVADNYSHTGDADLLATSHVGTSSATGDPLLEDLAIGEIVTYEVTIVLPDTENAGELVLVPTSILDTLPSGLGLVDARVVAIGGNLTIGESDGGEIVTDTSSAILRDADGVAGGAALTTSGTASTNLAIGDSLLGGSANIVGTVGGSTVTFDFGGLAGNTVVEDENGDGTFERENTGAFTDLIGTEQSIVVQIDAVVLDNAATDPIANPYVNEAQLTWEQVTGSPVVITDDAEVEVVEPEMDITKSFRDPSSGVDLYTIEPDDQVLVELSVTNTGNGNAYDVVVDDEIDLTYWQNITPQTTPAGFSFALTDGSNPTAMDTVVYTMDSDSGAGITDADNFIAPGEVVVIEFLMEYNGAGGPGFELNNTANVEGNALSEDSIPDPQLPGGGSAGLDVDRDSDDSDTDNVYEAPSLDKSFVAGLNPDTASNQYDPTIPDLAIGEVVTYELEITLPESPVDAVGAVIPIQVNLIDDLPDGFGLVGVEITDIGSAVSSPNLAVGDSIEILDPVALTPIVDANPAISTADNFADPDATQDQVTFDFGAVTVDPTSNDVAQQTITVQVTAVVLDISPENDPGEVRTNEATLEFFGTPTGNPAAPFDTTTPIEKTDSVDVEIVIVPDDPIAAVASPFVNPTPPAVDEPSIFDIFRYDAFGREGDDFDELMLQIRNDVQYEIEKLPVHYMATGITEHGSNVTMVVYGEDGAIIGSRTVLADAAGNWVMTFPNLILQETPHHVEVTVTPVSYNDSTAGEFNTRVYYTPALDSRHFHSKPLTAASVFAEQAENVMQSQHMGNQNPLGSFEEDWNHPQEFLAISNNEKI